jgi:hypothetical protein
MPAVQPPPGLTELEYRRWLGEMRQRAADGEPVSVPDLPRRDMRVIEPTFRRVPALRKRETEAT